MKKLSVALLAVLMVFLCGCSASSTGSAAKQSTGSGTTVADGLVNIHVNGDTDLPGNFFLSFVYSRNIIMLDGHGKIVWSKHEEQPSADAQTGWWDFKKHQVNGKTYYSYHDQTGEYDNYGLEGYAPGERVILDENFQEVKRVKFEASSTTKKGDPLDGHDFLMVDLDHYFLSGYIHGTVYNVPGYEKGSKVVYSYLQEVKNGEVVWDWKSVDYPELYSLTVTDGTPTANDYGNVQTDVPDIIHFNAMRLDDDGNLICSFRNLSTILCLDRTKTSDQIKWKLSGNGDEFGLAEEQKSSCQHYVTVDGNTFMVFNNGNKQERTGVISYTVDTKNKTTELARRYDFNGKFSRACGSVTRASGDIYTIGWGAATKDLECMSVVNLVTGEKLLSVSIDDPQDFTYRCVYYE